MELIERYIYAVTRHLPEKQRNDIETELRGLIDDMLEQRCKGSQATTADIEAVLSELGEPAALGAKYAGKPRYLIGPELFDTYIMVLKIALAATVSGMFVALIVNYTVTPPYGMCEIFGNVFGSIISAAAGAFTWVTVIFALIEYKKGNAGDIKWKRHEWKPSDLPEIPVKSALIKRSEPITGIVFILIFYIIINYAPGLFSVYRSGFAPITIFNLNVLKTYILLINISLGVSIIKEILKLVYGRYNFRLTIATLILSSISFIVTMIVFSNFSIWNLDFVSSIKQTYSLTLPAGFSSVQPVLVFAKVFLGITIFSFAVELIKSIVRTIPTSTGDISRFKL